jgi:uncharacterized membrane protein
MAAAAALPNSAHAPVRAIGVEDLKDALRLGVDDFRAMPSHAIFLVAIYPVIGLLLGSLLVNQALIPLLYPVVAGFALLGPLAALGLYELSRRREQGLPASAGDAAAVLHAPGFGAIVQLGLMLLAIFLAWLFVAQAVFYAVYGDIGFRALPDLIRDVLTTGRGWTLIVVGSGIGFFFALAVLVMSVVSFPMLVDRATSAPYAVATSIAAVQKSPRSFAIWGLIVAAGLALGSLPFFLGLTVVLPVLGHATWHLYRKAVAPEPGAPARRPARPEEPPVVLAPVE